MSNRRRRRAQPVKTVTLTELERDLADQAWARLSARGSWSSYTFHEREVLIYQTVVQTLRDNDLAPYGEHTLPLGAALRRRWEQ